MTRLDVHLVRLSLSSEDDVSVVQEVLEDAPDYSFAVTGRLPGEDAAHTLFEELPEGCRSEDKFVFAIRHGSRIVGCADVVVGYPEASTVFIGLLLVREREQGRGVGAAAYERLEDQFRKLGRTKARLAVVETNPRALIFWERCGFKRTGERREYVCGDVESHLVVLEKRIGARPKPLRD